MTYIYKGDSLGAFGEHGIKVNLYNPENYTVAKAEFKVGNLPKMIFDNPTFPLYINLTPNQTSGLEQQTICYLAVYDENGNKVTCKGKFNIVARDKVV